MSHHCSDCGNEGWYKTYQEDKYKQMEQKLAEAVKVLQKARDILNDEYPISDDRHPSRWEIDQAIDWLTGASINCKSKRILLIDDCRSPANYDATHTARTFNKGLEMIREGSWDVIIFDHDLGDEDPAHTGYDLMCYLEQNPEYIPKDIWICTSNPVGRVKMQALANRLLGIRYKIQG